MRAREREVLSDAEPAKGCLRDLVDSLGGSLWVANAQTFQFTFVSRHAARVLGYPVKRWLRDPTFWKDHVHPEDRDRAVKFSAAATGEKRHYDLEYRMIGAGGREVWLRDVVTVL